MSNQFHKIPYENNCSYNNSNIEVDFHAIKIGELKWGDDLIGAKIRQRYREPSEESFPKDVEVVIPEIFLFAGNNGQDDEE